MILLISGLICVALGLVFPKSKIVSLVILCYIWVIYAFGYDNGDYLNYYIDYTLFISKGNFTSFSFSEEGYIYMAYFLSKYMHLDYQQFLIVSSTLCTILLAFLARKFTDKVNMLFVLFLLNPYWMMVCQTRFYFAFLITLAAMLALWKIPGFKGIFIFVVLILMASFFHRSVLLCMFFILARFKYRYIIAFIAVSWIGIFAVYTGIGNSFLNALFSENKIDSYVGDGSARSIVGVASLIIIYIAIVVSSYTMYYYNKHHEKMLEYKQNADTRIRDEYIFKFILICLAFALLQYVNKNLERYARFMLFMYYVMLINHGKKVPKYHISLCQVSCFGVILLYYAYFYVSFSGWFDHNLVPEMEKNHFIDFIMSK